MKLGFYTTVRRLRSVECIRIFNYTILQDTTFPFIHGYSGHCDDNSWKAKFIKKAFITSNTVHIDDNTTLNFVYINDEDVPIIKYASRSPSKNYGFWRKHCDLNDMELIREEICVLDIAEQLARGLEVNYAT